MRKRDDIIMPTDEEDREITEAAQADPDSPPLTDEDLAAMRPVDPAMLEHLRRSQRRRGPQRAPVKRQISVRLDPEIIDHFKEGGPGWQSRMNEALRSFIRGGE